MQMDEVSAGVGAGSEKGQRLASQGDWAIANTIRLITGLDQEKSAMTKITLTVAGLTSVALCTAAMADADVAFDVTGPGGNQVDYNVDMSGTLGDASIVVDFTNAGGWTWAGDLLIGVVDPNGNAVEYGGYNLSFGYSTAGDFPSSWDSSSSGSYGPHSFSLGGYGLDSSGSWTVHVADGYSGGASTDHWTGTLTLVGMDSGGMGGSGACCWNYEDCSVVSAEECAAGLGKYQGADTTCDEFLCAAPEGACCLNTGECEMALDEYECSKFMNGNYAGDGTTCDDDPPHCSGKIFGACCFGTECYSSNAWECGKSGGTFIEDGNCDDGVCDPDAGDTCEAAFAAMTGANAFDTSDATDSGYGDPDDLQCEGTYLDWDGSADRWFTWTASDDGVMKLDTCDDTSYDTSLVLYEGADCGSLVQIACNGDSTVPQGCQQYVSYIGDIAVTAGQTYYMRLGGWQAAVGTGTLNITFDGGGDPMGACCLGADCGIATSADCGATGGTYQGDDTNCDDTDCGGGPVGQPMTFATVGSNLVTGGGDNFTLDLFVIVGDGGRVDAVAGTNGQTKMLANSGDFYQSDFGGPTSMDVNPAFYGVEPDLEWDSRVTIGAIDSTGNPFAENALQNIGMDWTPFENGDDLVATNGTWFILPTDAQGEAQEMVAADCSTVHAVRIARLTATSMSDVITFEGLIQGRNPDGTLLSESAYIETGYVAMEDCNDNGVNDTCDIANGTSADTNGDGIPDECDPPCPGDVNGDSIVDVDDLLAVIAAFGTNDPDADVTNDGIVNVDDLLLVIAWFNAC